MKNLSMFMAFMAVTTIFVAADCLFAAAPSFTTLHPGQAQTINQNLTVNIVFVGFDPGTGPRDISPSELLGILPSEYRSVNRVPRAYGENSPTGLGFTYNYNLVYADAAFENAYFQYLSSIATPGPRTAFQDFYNQQHAKSLNIGQNYRINGTSAEKWLGDNAGPRLGVDTKKYTIFFVNWYGRSDFKFHVYIHPDEPDPDTGLNWGRLDADATVAWGGTTADDAESGLGSLHRLWFYDFSAGPEFWAGNFDVDDQDVDGDGYADYRIPPVWEYGNTSGYRPFTDLSGDMGLLTRYVAINLLFTSSPLYKTAISPPKLPSGIQLDINLYQQDTQLNARSFLNPAYIQSKVAKLQPYNTFSTEIKNARFSGRAADVFNCFAHSQSCYGQAGGFAYLFNLFIYDKDHILQFLEGDADYEIPIFIYTTTNDYANAPFIGGIADSNHADGTQSYIYIHWPRFISEFGEGLSEEVLHESGHHLGLSHPHDGYDSEGNFGYSAVGDGYFVWAGDESATIMGYMFVNGDYSQFDRDNMSRNMTCSYLTEANLILVKILASPRAGQVTGLLANADQSAGNALAKYQTMNYSDAAFSAKDAYVKVLTAAGQINVPVEKQAWPADYKSNGDSFMFDNVIDDRRSTHMMKTK